MPEERNPVREDLMGCWGNVKETLWILLGCSIVVPIVMCCWRLIFWGLLVTAIVSGLVYVTKAYRRGRW